MKKLILPIILFLFLTFVAPVKADIIPMSTKSIKHYGIGVLNLPSNYTVYKYPYFDSHVLREVNYDNIRKSAIVRTLDMRKISYIAYVPSNNVALLAVDLNPGNDWYGVFIDQKNGEIGWVYTEDKSAFMTYKELFYKYGKQYGIRFFNDLPKDDKVLYAKEDKSSRILDEINYPEHVNFTVIRGNWLLAVVKDLTKQAKVGWFNWRNEDGTLNMFPNFSEQR